MSVNRFTTHWKIWLFAIINIALIFLAVPIARTMEHALRNIFGTRIFLLITLIIIFTGIISFRWLLHRQSSHHRLRILGFFLVSALYAWRLVTLPVHAERFHLIEYGSLAVLISLGCCRARLGYTSFGWAMTIVWLVGLGDELFQWALPNRVGEWRDVVINLQSGGLAILAIFVLRLLPMAHAKPSIRTWLPLSISFALLCALSGWFFLTVHAFGSQHTDTEIGQFNSFFTIDQLLETTDASYRQFVTVTDEALASGQPLDISRYFYDREAKEHFDRVHFLIDLKRFSEANNEYRITEKYYQAFLHVTQRSFAPEIQHLLSETPPMPPTEFYSAVMDWLIVSVTREQVMCLSTGSCMVFLFFTVIILYLSTRQVRPACSPQK